MTEPNGLVFCTPYANTKSWELSTFRLDHPLGLPINKNMDPYIIIYSVNLEYIQLSLNFLERELGKTYVTSFVWGP